MSIRGKLTTNGRCNACGAQVAWRVVRGSWTLHDAARAADGTILRREEKITEPDGRVRTIMRRVPGDRHDCPARRGETAPASPAVTPLGEVTREPGKPAGIVAETAPAIGGTVAVTGTSPLVGTPIGTAPAAPAAEPVLPTWEDLVTDDVRSEWTRYHEAIATTDLRVLAFGPPGTGKTETPFRVAAANGWGIHLQQLTEETPAGDLAGMLIVQGGSTAWLDGSLGRAIRESHERPVIYVLDEIGRASADALSYTLVALSDPHTMRLVMRNGETISPKPENWHCVATSNDPPESLPDPVRSRLVVQVMLAGPGPGLVGALTTAEARRLACSRAREYDTRALVAYDKLRAAGWTIERAAGIVWPASVARSLVDVLKIEAARPVAPAKKAGRK